MDLNLKLKDGFTFEIDIDEDAYSPRDPHMNELWNKVVSFHRHYNLSDEHDYDQNDYKNWEEFEAAIVARENPIVLLPLYLYEHGGIRISTTPFGCEWDSGQIGFVYASTMTIDNVGMGPNLTEEWGEFQDRLEKGIREDIDLYDLYVSGQNYRLTIYDKEGDVEESIAGFYGSDWDKNGVMDYLEPYLIKAASVADL